MLNCPFIQLFSRVEQKTGTIISNGRMDQNLYPYYKADKEKGLIDEDSAEELLECVWVAMARYIDLYLSKAGGAFNEGYAHWEAVTIGGQTPDGRDAVNELTYIFLRSKREFPLNYPDLAARIHTRSSELYLYEVAETIKDGSGFPKLINDEEVVPLLLAKGAKFDEAYDYSVSGCAECRMPNRDTFTSPCAYINFAAALEMTVYNGRMLKYGDEVIGLQTGEAEDFHSFDEFLNAYLRQQKNFMKQAFIQQHEIIRLRAEHFASPLGSSLHKLCINSLFNDPKPQPAFMQTKGEKIMIFHTFGNKDNEVIVLIHGMLTPWQIWEDTVSVLSKNYYVVVPELDAHTEDEPSRFISVENEAEQLRAYLTEQFGGELYALCGLSMGGRIAATLAGMEGITGILLDKIIQLTEKQLIHWKGRN